MKADSKFYPWVALLTTVATYALIAMGGLVRASGSGLGCPDWPKCFGRWYPPFSAADVPASIDPRLFNFAKAWTEYANRLIGVAVGLLIFATLVLALAEQRAWRIRIPSALAFILVGMEGALGGRVVSSRLSPMILSLHLVLALTIVGLLLYATFVALERDIQRPDGQRSSVFLGRAGLVFAFGVSGQIVLGALLRGRLQEVAANPRLDRALWVTETGAIGTLHQSLAPLIGLGALVLMAGVYRRPSREKGLRFWAWIVAGLVMLQVWIGFGLIHRSLPPLLQVAHLCVGSLLLGALTIFVLSAYRTCVGVSD